MRSVTTYIERPAKKINLPCVEIGDRSEHHSYICFGTYSMMENGDLPQKNTTHCIRYRRCLKKHLNIFANMHSIDDRKVPKYICIYIIYIYMLHPCSTGRTKWLSSIIYTCNVVVGIRSRCLNIGQNLNANVDPFTAVVRHLLNQHHHHYFHLTQSTHDLLDDGLPSRSKGCTRTRQLKRTWTSVV